MNKINYQQILDEIIKHNKKNGVVPTLFLHSCCAPCSSYVIDYLSQYFKITVFYYNPNITEKEEYNHRVQEQKRLIKEMPCKNQVDFVQGNYDHLEYLSAIKGLEQEKEGGKRCVECFMLRLVETAKQASIKNADYFATTLTISPLKNAGLINKIGIEISKEYNIEYLCSDFKKKEGYKKSIDFSVQYNLYRQSYCGCVFSKKEQENKIVKK